MPKKKIVVKPKDCDIDNQDGLLSPCFQINSNVELKDIPTTGEEYLLKVIKERENYSQVTKCDKDFSKFAKNQSCFVNELPLAKVPDNLKPTIEWQNIQVADFSDVRLYISRLLANKSQWPNSIKVVEIDQDNLIGWRKFFDINEPTLSCVLGLRYTLLDRALEVLTDIIDDVEPGKTIDYKTGSIVSKHTLILRFLPGWNLPILKTLVGFGMPALTEDIVLNTSASSFDNLSSGVDAICSGQWIYAFLACTRQPLLSDTTSILRNLARKCAEIRSHLNPEAENIKEAVAPLNIFICLVSRYFRQYDLAD